MLQLLYGRATSCICSTPLGPPDSEHLELLRHRLNEVHHLDQRLAGKGAKIPGR